MSNLEKEKDNISKRALTLSELEEALRYESSDAKVDRFNPVGVAVLAFLLMVTLSCLLLAIGSSKLIDLMWF